MKNKWIKLLNRKSSFGFSIALTESNSVLLKEKIGVTINNFWEDSITNNICYVGDEIYQLGAKINSIIIKDEEFISNNIKECKSSGLKLLKLAESLQTLSLTNLSNDDIASFLKELNRSYVEFMYFVLFPHAIEAYIDKALTEALASHFGSNVISEIKQILTLPKELDYIQQTDIFNAVKVIKNNPQKLAYESKKLQAKYGWMPMWSLTSRPLTEEFYQKQIQDIIKDKVDIEKMIKNAKIEQKQHEKKFKNEIEKIKDNPLLLKYVGLIQEYSNLRIYRKDVYSKTHYYLIPLLKEIAKRSNLMDAIFYMSFNEIIDLLRNKNANPKKYFDRIKGYAVYMHNGKTEIITGKIRILNQLYKLVPDLKDEVKLSLLSSVKGIVASKGKATGRVVVVNSISEINKVRKGDILVTPMTTPDYTAVMNKVAAIVTNEGGVTCHAAIIAREFNLPCIVSSKIATKVFKDGEKVEVDAENGICKKII